MVQEEPIQFFNESFIICTSLIKFYFFKMLISNLDISFVKILLNVCAP